MNWCYFRLLLFPFVFVAETALMLASITLNFAIDDCLLRPLHGLFYNTAHLILWIRQRCVLAPLVFFHNCITNTPSASWYVGGPWEDQKDDQ